MLSVIIVFCFLGSNGYVVFYFEDFAEETPYTLMIEGSRLDGQREPFSLSTVFHLRKSHYSFVSRQ